MNTKIKSVAGFFVLLNAAVSSFAQAPSSSSDIAGQWNVSFPNGVVKLFNIDASGKVNFIDSMHGPISGEIKRVAEGVYAVDFSDKKVQRITSTAAGELSVEQWSSALDRDSGKKPMLAKGVRNGTAATPAKVELAPANPAAVVQSAPQGRAIQLAPGWDSLHKGGEITIRDLALSLRGVGSSNANLATTDEIRIYEGITFLMPLKEAVQSLGLNQKPPTRKKVACPGFPKDALDCVLYDGLFEGRFNRICLVVDAADQVVSVQLIEESPKSVDSSGVELQNTYNFVETRLKSLGALRVFSKTAIQNPRTSEWVNALTPGLMKSPPLLVRVDSWVKNGAKPLEYVRWYAPMPFVDLLQYCIQRNVTGK